jgi:predicted MFS family arabinose efflux permease
MTRHTTGWRTTWALLVFMLVNFADKTVMGLAAQPIMDDLGLSRQEFGMAAAAFFALFSVSALAVSYLTRTVPTTVLLLGLALLWTAAQVPMLWPAAGFGTLVVTRVLLGAAEGPAMPVATHHLHGWFPQHERTLPTAVLLTGAAAGVAVAAPTLTLIIDRFGWRWAFGAVGLAGLLWAGYWALRGAGGPYAPGGAQEESWDTVAVPYRRILLSGTWLSAALGAFAAYWTLSANLTWMPDYLQEVVGLSPHQAGALVTVAALAGGVVLVGHGLLARRRSRPPAGAGSGVLMCLAAGAVALFAVTDAVWAKVLLMLGPMALANVIMTVAQTACARITPGPQRGVVLGALTFVYALAGVLSPWAIGRVVDTAGAVATGYRAAFLLTAALLAVTGLLAVWRLRPERDAQRMTGTDSLSPPAGQVTGARVT